MKKMTAVIFDLFGTLLFLSQDSRPFLELARRNHGSSLRSDLHTAITSECISLENFAKRIGLPRQPDMMSLQMALHADLSSVRIYDDTVPVLEALKKRDIKVGLISNIATLYKTAFINQSLAQYFNAIIFSCDCGLAKPDPAIYLLALEQLGCSAEETLMIGDNLRADVVGPASVGIDSLHLLREGKKGHRAISTLTDVLPRVA